MEKLKVIDARNIDGGVWIFSVGQDGYSPDVAPVANLSPEDEKTFGRPTIGEDVWVCEIGAARIYSGPLAIVGRGARRQNRPWCC